MKQIYKAVAISVLLMPLALTVQAEEKATDTPPPPPPPHEMHPGMGMGMHGDMMQGMPTLEKLKEMQAHMLLMHDLSNKILAEKDPKKQQALKDQQLEIMKAHIADRMAKHHHMKMSHPAPPPASATEEKK
jgi:hypothetical protein